MKSESEQSIARAIYNEGNSKGIAGMHAVGSDI
jgi:hypothetical protein